MLRGDDQGSDFSDATAGILASVDLLLQQTQGSLLIDEDDGAHSETQHLLSSLQSAAHHKQRGGAHSDAFKPLAPPARSAACDEDTQRCVPHGAVLFQAACQCTAESRSTGTQFDACTVSVSVQTTPDYVSLASSQAPRPPEVKVVACQTESPIVRSTQTDPGPGTRVAEVTTDCIGGIVAEETVARSLAAPVLQWTRVLERSISQSLGNLSTRLVRQLHVAFPRIQAALQRKNAECRLAREDAEKARGELQALKQALVTEEQLRSATERALETQRIDSRDLQLRFDAVAQNNLVLADRVQLLEELVFRYEAVLAKRRKPAAAAAFDDSDADSAEGVAAFEERDSVAASSLAHTPRQRAAASASVRPTPGDMHQKQSDDVRGGHAGRGVALHRVPQVSSSSLNSLIDLYRQCELALRDD